MQALYIFPATNALHGYHRSQETQLHTMWDPYLLHDSHGRAGMDDIRYPGHPFAERIVLHLIDNMLQTASGTGYHLFTDRYYTSCVLADELLKRRIHLTGTVMKNRSGLPASVKKKIKLKQQETQAWVKGNKMVCLVWQDKRQVLMLSTYHSSGEASCKLLYSVYFTLLYSGQVQMIQRRGFRMCQNQR